MTLGRVKVSHGVARFENLADLIFNCLPVQGAIEIQNDEIGRASCRERV